MIMFHTIGTSVLLGLEHLFPANFEEENCYIVSCCMKKVAQQGTESG